MNSPDPFKDFVPPHDIEAEQSVLGCLLAEPSCAPDAAALLTPADFYRPGHAAVFEAALSLCDRGFVPDARALSGELSRRDRLEMAGGEAYLVSLSDVVLTAANLEHWAGIVADRARRRRVIEAALRGIAQARQEDADIADTSARLQSQVADADGPRAGGRSELIREPMLRIWERAEASAANPGAVTGLPTGVARWDAITGGLQPSDLVVIAGRPSMGKTSMALCVAEHAAVAQSRRVAVFSLEMSADQLAERMVCSRAEVSSHRLRAGRLSPDEWRRLEDVYRSNYPALIHIDDSTDATPAALRGECRRLARQGPLDLIVVDYLQQMRGDRRGQQRREEIDEIARGLKSLAREFHCPVVALAQLSRDVEKRENKRPVLSDLRESGQIEAEADMVCFLYREAYYQQKSRFGEGADTDTPPAMEQAELIVGKHRNGPTGIVPVGFVPQFARFDNWQ